jgi:hypothetical protein
MQGLQKFPKDGFLNLASFRFSVFDQDYAKAEEILMGITDFEALKSGWQDVLDFIKVSRKTELLEPMVKKLPIMISETSP